MFVIKDGKIIVGKPLYCPFRRGEECCVSIKQETVIRSCSADFVLPDDCPLRKLKIMVKQ